MSLPAIRFEVDQRVRDCLGSVRSRAYKNMLRRSTYQHSKPALAAAKAATPVKSGRLQTSLALANFATQDGEVGATVAPKQTSFTYRDANGRKNLVRALKHKQKAGDAAREAKILARGGRVIVGSNPFFYALMIETGKHRDGSIARRAGAAKFLERGLTTGVGAFRTGVTEDVFEFVTHPPAT